MGRRPRRPAVLRRRSQDPCVFGASRFVESRAASIIPDSHSCFIKYLGWVQLFEEGLEVSEIGLQLRPCYSTLQLRPPINLEGHNLLLGWQINLPGVPLASVHILSSHTHRYIERIHICIYISTYIYVCVCVSYIYNYFSCIYVYIHIHARSMVCACGVGDVFP